MADSRGRLGKSKINLQQLAVPGSNEVLKEQKDGGAKGTRGPTWKSSQWPKLEQFEQ